MGDIGSRSRRGAVLALAAALSIPGSAYAADPAGDAPTTRRATPDEARVDAEKRLDEGLNRYAKGDYEGARLAFAQAYAVLTSIDLLYNLSRAEVKSGHALEAIVHIRQMLRDPKATTDDKAKAQHLLDEANRLTGHIAVEAPDGAQIFLDHVDSGEAPIRDPYDVTPGKHEVEARGGGGSREVEVDAPAGGVVTTRFALAMGAPPTVSAPVPLPPPLPEEHPTPAPTEEHERHHDSAARVIVPVVIGAVGVIGLGVGIGLGVASQGKQNDAATFRASNPTGFCADRSSTLCGQYQSLLDSQQTDTDVSRGMLIGGGVLVAAALVTYLVWPHHHAHRDRDRDAEKSSTWLVPSPAGMGLGGVF